MASTEQLPTGRWRGIYRDATGRKRSKSFDHKRPARAWAEKQEARAHRGHQDDPHAGKVPWGEWYAQWNPTRQLAGSTRRSTDTRTIQHVRPRWDAVPLVGIRRMDVQRWVTTELPRAGLSASSIRSCFYTLSSSMKAALVENLIDANPCVGVKLPTRPPGRERYLTPNEESALLYQLDEPYRMLCELLVGTGLRISEACGLHRDRIDLDAGVVRVREVWDVRSRQMLAYPKGKKARTVPLGRGLADRLQAWFDAHPAAGECGQTHPEGRCPGPLAFTGPGRWRPSGKPIDPHNFTNVIWPVALDASEIAHATPHDLRHTYASRLVQNRVELSRVRDLLGHASITTTERYAHLAPDQFDAVRAVLDGGEPERDTWDSDGTPAVPAPRRDVASRSRIRAV